MEDAEFQNTGARCAQAVVGQDPALYRQVGVGEEEEGDPTKCVRSQQPAEPMLDLSFVSGDGSPAAQIWLCRIKGIR